MKKLFYIATLCVLAVGCATTPPPPPITIPDVISMSKQHVWDDEIIRKIAQSRTVFHLGANDIVRLRNEGVSEHVINYMMDTYTRFVADEQRRQDSYYYYNSFYYGPYYRRRWW